MDKNTENNKESRRDFINRSLMIGAGTIAGAGLLASNSCVKEPIGETVKLLSPDGKLVEVDKAYLGNNTVEKLLNREEIRAGIPGRKFVMVIDLSKCKNARKCVEACQEYHDLPPNREYISVYLMNNTSDDDKYWFPKPCFHCDNPPCVKVCPVNATFKRDDGIVLIDSERCLGCKFCMTACPYSARSFSWEISTVEKNSIRHTPERCVPNVPGTVTKCDFCPDLARVGELQPCAAKCPNGVIYFGDRNEDTVSNGQETLRFSEMLHERSAYRYAEDLGTEASVYYLPPVDRMFPVESGFKNLSKEEIDKYHLTEEEKRKYKIPS